MIVLILLVLPYTVICSLGEKETIFVRCVEKCLKSEAQKKDHSWFQWELNRECQYNCMMIITKAKEKNKMPIYQYFGKVNIFAWVCAAIFHAKDTILTERLDYFGASLIMSFSILLSVARFSGIHHKLTYTSGLVLLLILFYHTYTMNFIEFDYSHNMRVMIILGLVNISFWMVWCFKHSYRYYVWKCVLTMVGTFLFASLELWDFPPIFYTFDAHSLWHLSTVPLTYLWYRFLYDDACYELYERFKLA
ncbi:post-GPI attachment to proteins factor 3 isoform X2 [Hydra vulgaris]|uniref:post-GPI attachment to proteins factor 3 isoform X2 n=1 Tax=Hydra vulgaris TaxID=6087 RepID=UPI001F5EEDDA|nr:post-GPI attachment to proteins factor 3 isoform X2 [Hydra vulgaris]